MKKDKVAIQELAIAVALMEPVVRDSKVSDSAKAAWELFSLMVKRDFVAECEGCDGCDEMDRAEQSMREN